MKTLTVFTPTYNRRHTLVRLYESLCRQSCKDFVWLIIDDGSRDGTVEQVRDWISERNIDIVYEYQENAGKPMAHNRGVELTETELFTCVDSDDYLTDDAVEIIANTDISSQDCIGILLKRGSDKETPITMWNADAEYTTLYDAHHKYGMSGDTMLVYKSEIIKKYKFPHFEGEKFIPEAYLYDKLDREGRLKVVDRITYICEYLPDGYTASMQRINAENPVGYREFVLQRLKMEAAAKPAVSRDAAFDLIRLISADIILEKKAYKESFGKRTYNCMAFLLYPLGMLRYHRDFKRYTR